MKRRRLQAAQPPTIGKPRFDAIQVLRFLAASIVVLYHCLHYAQASPLPGLADALSVLQRAATYAVVQFFCISGFVVGLSLEGRASADFLRARLLRIYPALWLAVAVALLIAKPGTFSFDAGLLRGLALLPVGDAASWTLGIEWTLVHEIVFYLAAAGLWAFRSERILIAGHVAWLLFILAAPWLAPGWHLHFLTLRYVLTNPPSAAFILGLLVYFNQRRLGSLPAVGAFLAGLAFVIAAARVEEVWRSFGMDIGCALILLAATRVRRVPAWAARSGDWSYGVYLIHVPLITAALRYHRVSGWPGYALFAAAILTLAAFFGMAEHWLHRRFFAKLFRPRRQNVARAI